MAMHSELLSRVFDTNIDGQLFAATGGTDDDTPSYRKARASEHWPKWQEACEGEINNLRRNGTIDEDQAVPEDTLPTWSPTWDAAKGRASQVVNILWVLRIKYVDGVLDKIKARAVFDGRSQKAKDPTLETFLPAWLPLYDLQARCRRGMSQWASPAHLGRRGRVPERQVS